MASFANRGVPWDSSTAESSKVWRDIWPRFCIRKCSAPPVMTSMACKRMDGMMAWLTRLQALLALLNRLVLKRGVGLRDR